MRIAVNFPYFIPYSGYFRLFASTDIFVIFDCVPFPRRGYVHRNQLLDYSENLAWFTLPVKKVSRDTCIKDIQLVDDIQQAIQDEANRFPLLQSFGEHQHPLVQQCMQAKTNLVDYIEDTLRVTNELLGLPFNIIRSSSLNIDKRLRGEARVLAIVKALGGTEYINAPGGRHLYDEKNFADNQVKLSYLDDYQGPKASILQRLLSEDIDTIREDIINQSL